MVLEANLLSVIAVMVVVCFIWDKNEMEQPMTIPQKIENKNFNTPLFFHRL